MNTVHCPACGDVCNPDAFTLGATCPTCQVWMSLRVLEECSQAQVVDAIRWTSERPRQDSNLQPRD